AHYEIKSLSDIAAIKGGKRLPKGKSLIKTKTNHPYLRVTDFSNNGTIDVSDLHYISEDIYNIIKNYTITSEDLYITIVGATIGKSGIIPKELDGANLTENACKLIFKGNISNKYVYYFTKTKSFNEQSLGNIKIAAVPKLALTRLATIKLPIPDIEKQKQIVDKLDKFQEQTKQLEAIYTQKIKECDELKQSILQKAFRGEL
ncbi:restriction endonuclease subunit S, partial [bacterium]|nr:restriction endonuclease subunit S [bacterium]